jgi:hypothetical protein
MENFAAADDEAVGGLSHVKQLGGDSPDRPPSQ